jgi:hypothetical protein
MIVFLPFSNRLLGASRGLVQAVVRTEECERIFAAIMPRENRVFTALEGSEFS